MYSGERISRNPKKRKIAYETIFEQHKENIIKNPKAYYNFLISGSNIYSRNGESVKAFSYGFKAFLINPLAIKSNFELFFKNFIRVFYKKSNL